MGRFEQVDWERVYKVLYITACQAVMGAPNTFDCGISAEDLVGETLATFWASPNALGWKPAKGSLESFLSGVLQHKAIDHLRRQKHVGGSFDDATFSPKQQMMQENRVEEEIDHQAIRNELHELLAESRDLQDLVAATEFISGSHNVNQELAEVLDKAPQDVVNLKRRLVANPRVIELIYGKQKITKPKTS